MDSDLSTLALRFTDVDLLLAVSGRLQSGVNAGLERWCVLATVGEGVVGHVSVGEQIWFGKIVMMHCEKKAVTYWLAISIPESQKIICEVQDLYKVPNVLRWCKWLRSSFTELRGVGLILSTVHTPSL